ncbi:MAG: hypothetical protein HRT44_03820 [Bdellovibrionales bacterium]|nr:hypothetical protein [Bdellovibrionales bacterium]NQZ18371.1 hypothetical protein [Bdellovibrionales bacterium]
MIRLLSFIAVASFMIPSVSEAKNRPRTEQLRNLGQQMVETVLRGAELNPANRVKNKGCW